MSKDSIVTTVCMVLLFLSASLITSKSYLSGQSVKVNGQVILQNQNVKPVQETAPVAVPDPVKEEVKSKPVIESPTKKPVVIAETIPLVESPTKKPVIIAETISPKVAVPVCDEGQKSLAASKFKVGYYEALSDFKSKMKPYNTPDEDQIAMNELNAKVELLYNQYLQDIKSANCSPEPLVGGLI